MPRFFHRPVYMLSMALVGTLLLGVYIYGIQLESPASSPRLKGARSLLGVFSKGSSMRGHGFNVHNSAIRKQTRPHVFATVFHSELTNKFNMDQPESVGEDELVRVLKSMETAGVSAVVYSLTWQFAQPDKDTIQWDYIDRIMGAACNNTSLKVRGNRGALTVCLSGGWGCLSEGCGHGRGADTCRSFPFPSYPVCRHLPPYIHHHSYARKSARPSVALSPLLLLYSKRPCPPQAQHAAPMQTRPSLAA